jgi:hypothetical protein
MSTQTASRCILTASMSTPVASTSIVIAWASTLKQSHDLKAISQPLHALSQSYNIYIYIRNLFALKSRPQPMIQKIVKHFTIIYKLKSFPNIDTLMLRSAVGYEDDICCRLLSLHTVLHRHPSSSAHETITKEQYRLIISIRCWYLIFTLHSMMI